MVQRTWGRSTFFCIAGCTCRLVAGPSIVLGTHMKPCIAIHPRLSPVSCVPASFCSSCIVTSPLQVSTYHCDIKRLAVAHDPEAVAQLEVQEVQAVQSQAGSEQGTEWKLFLIQELCVGSLDALMLEGVFHTAGGAMYLDLASWVLADVAAGLEYLHSKQVWVQTGCVWCGTVLYGMVWCGVSRGVFCLLLVMLLGVPQPQARVPVCCWNGWCAWCVVYVASVLIAMVHPTQEATNPARSSAHSCSSCPIPVNLSFLSMAVHFPRWKVIADCCHLRTL